MLVAHPRRMAVDVAEERLLAPVHHLHRLAGVEREQAGVDLHAEVLARAERAADAAERDPHLVGRQVEAGGDLVAVDVQPLGGHEEVDAAVLGRHREPGLGAEERLVLHPDLVLAGDHDLGGRVRVAVLDVDVPQQVAGRVQRLGVEGVLGIGDRRQRLEVDLDLRGGAARGLGVVGGDDRDRLALVAHLVPGEDRLVGDLEPVGLAAGDVLVGEDRVHAGDGERGRDVELADAGARVGAAEGGAPQHPVGPQVGRVGELALDLGDAVGPADALADPALGGCLDRHTATSCIRRLGAVELARDGLLVGGREAAVLDHGPAADQQRVDLRAGTEHERGDRVGDAGVVEVVEPPEGDVGQLAGLERADLLGTAEAAGAVDRAERERLAGGQRLRAALDAGDQQRLSQLAGELAGLVGGRAVDAEAHGRAGGGERGHRRDAGAETGVRARAVGDAGAGLAELRDLALVEVDAVGEPDVVAEPADLLEVLDRPDAEQLEAELLLVERLRHVGVEADALLPRELGGLRHQPLGDAERRARRERDPCHRVRRRDRGSGRSPRRRR